VGVPDDPLRADDALVGAEHEDVLLDSGAADDGEQDADYADPRHDVDEHPTSIAPPLDDRPTTEIPRVVGPAPEPRGRFAGVKPWAVFAAVAVVVITTTTTLASWLQGPTAERQSFTGLMQPPTPTATVAPPAPVEATPPPPPSAEPEPKPEPKPQPAARPTTQRPRATRAPAAPPPPPPAAAVNAPATPDGEKQKEEEESAPKTSAPRGAAVAEAPETTGGTDSADAEKQKEEEDSDD
jgi:hypothetical protein